MGELYESVARGVLRQELTTRIDAIEERLAALEGTEPPPPDDEVRWMVAFDGTSPHPWLPGCDLVGCVDEPDSAAALVQQEEQQ